MLYSLRMPTHSAASPAHASVLATSGSPSSFSSVHLAPSQWNSSSRLLAATASMPCSCCQANRCAPRVLGSVSTWRNSPAPPAAASWNATPSSLRLAKCRRAPGTGGVTAASCSSARLANCLCASSRCQPPPPPPAASPSGSRPTTTSVPSRVPARMVPDPAASRHSIAIGSSPTTTSDTNAVCIAPTRRGGGRRGKRARHALVPSFRRGCSREGTVVPGMCCCREQGLVIGW
mmetsp:Transcript_7024/g.18011  ORF Transcript_7024/g.18011 Transcript_7024/m.18011 type:complete len:233 (-) Transcript_7024:43-741(-)